MHPVADSDHRTVPLFSTGVPNLDLLLGGGLPRQGAIVLTGQPGSGKTILACQIAFAQAAASVDVVFASITSESHEKLLRSLRTMSFFNESLVGEKLFMVSVYHAMKQGPKEARDVLLRVVRERKARLLVIDGLRAMRDLWQDESKVRDFLYDVGVGLTQLDASGLFTTEYPLERLLEYPEATTVDGILSLSQVSGAESVHRRLEVSKLRGAPHLPGRHVFRITSDGIVITPRLESMVQPLLQFTAQRERLSFGLPDLDTLLKGGLPAQSATLMIGGPGVGKTLSALTFAIHGHVQRQPSLFVSLTEPPDRILRRGEQVGMKPQAALSAGALQVQYLPAFQAESDELITTILDAARQMGAKRVVIDGLEELEYRLLDRQRARPFTHALLIALKQQGITALFTREVSAVASPELNLAESPFSGIAENLILLRHFELQGRIYRVLSVLKARDTDFDSDLREFRITDNGLRVLEPLSSATGLLTGAGRPVTGMGKVTNPGTGEPA